MNYFATPVSSEQSYNNYNNTVVNGVEKSHLQSLGLKDALEDQKDNLVRLWGLKKDQIARWNKVNKGDIVCFYYKKNIISYCEVLSKDKNIDVAENLWGWLVNRHYNFTWPLLIILSKPKFCKISFLKFNKILGYKDHYFLRSFFKLNKLEGYIHKKYGSIEKFVKAESEPD